ncbi:MAG: DUF2336 domain-containing protein [Rhizomicrobium sp.]
MGVESGPMTAAKERLTHLIELATKDAPENRRLLATELCDLLLDWPSHYPAQMREPFEALLEKTVRSIDADTRRALAERIGAREGVPLPVLNEFYFDAAPDTRDAIVLRNALLEDGKSHEVAGADETQIVAAARKTANGKFSESFAQLLGIEPVVAQNILHDRSGRALAIACKGAHMTRAAFSALTLLTETNAAPDETRERLSSFDSVPLTGAERLLDYWRSRAA